MTTYNPQGYNPHAAIRTLSDLVPAIRAAQSALEPVVARVRRDEAMSPAVSGALLESLESLEMTVHDVRSLLRERLTTGSHQK